MTVVTRTAYPSFKLRPTVKELTEFYTPTEAEIRFARSCVKSPTGVLRWLVMLKSFQRLGYFPQLEGVPANMVNHLRSCLELNATVSAIPSLRASRTYQEQIRNYLQVKPYDRTAQERIATLVAQAAEAKDHPADLINVAIEELVKERYELPAFSTLDRLVGHVREIANTRLFQRVSSGLTPGEQTYLDQLVMPESPEVQATLNLLKSPPKKATLSAMQQLQTKFDQLMTFGDAKRLLAKLPLTKVKSFAAQAKALDIAELRDIKPPKRRTLLLCLLYQSQVKTRDHLVDMFLKRIQIIHRKAKTRLEVLREQNLAHTETLLQLLKQILQVSHDNPENEVLGEQIKSLLADQGGATLLLEQCQEIAAYNSSNYLPLMWRYYARYRKLLFHLVRSLEIRSTSQDETLMQALSFILAHQHRRGKVLASEIDLRFASSRWRQLVVSRQGESLVLNRQQLEICVFAYLAMELKTGDACVIGSEAYADLREQMLSWEACKPQLADYCQALGFPDTAEAFVQQFKATLTQRAAAVDQICKTGDQVSINKQGSRSCGGYRPNRSHPALLLWKRRYWNAYRSGGCSISSAMPNTGYTGLATLVRCRGRNPSSTRRWSATSSPPSAMAAISAPIKPPAIRGGWSPPTCSPIRIVAM